jgi:serine/threonine protein kinase
MIGYLIGNYKITGKIGEGGMGDVFKGLDIMLEREVAIKMLRPELTRQQAIVERFRAEAVTLARLNHPNIATLYNFVRQGNDYFMVMEYVKGLTFENLIKKHGAMPWQRAIQLFAQALEGITHAHRLGIIHRDLKPANVMLMDSGLIKVMDFGIARVLGSNRLTRTGNVIGTMEYMSPEQIRGEDTDARSDIYSAGILLYEMLTGRVPFECNSEYELMRRQVEEAPMPPRLFSKEIPLPVEQAIMRSLAKKPAARFHTADEFRTVILQSIAGAAAVLIPSQAGQGKPSPAKKEPDTLDFTSAPPQNPKETRLPDVPQPTLKETRLAQDGQGEPQAILKPRGYAGPNGQQNPTPEVQQAWHDNRADSSRADASSSASSVAALVHKLNWKHFAAAVLLALLSIPIAFLASSETPPQANANQSQSKSKSVNSLEAKNEATAQPPSLPREPEPTPVQPAESIEDEAPPVSAARTRQQPPQPAANGRKTPRVASQTPANAKEPVKANPGDSGNKNDDKKAARRDDRDDEKKKDKKGGIFDKVKGGLKKINPFKKD